MKKCLKNIMHPLIVILFVLVSSQSVGAFVDKENAVEWYTNLEDALQRAKEEKKKILIYFSGSDWCLPCMHLKREVLKSEEFETYADTNFILVAFDFPAKSKNQLPEAQQLYNESMAEKYNPDGAFPLMVIIESDGLELGKIDGYSRQGLDAYINQLNSILEKKK